MKIKTSPVQSLNSHLTKSLNDNYNYSVKVLLDKNWLSLRRFLSPMKKMVKRGYCSFTEQTRSPRRVIFGTIGRWIFWFHWWRLCKSSVWCLDLNVVVFFSLCSLTGSAADRMTLRRSCDTVSLAQSTGRMSTTRRWEQDLAASSYLLWWFVQTAYLRYSGTRVTWFFKRSLGEL